MILKELLKDYRLILASGSPRRQKFFKDLELDFEIRLRPIDEIFPDDLKGVEISDYLAKQKAAAFEGELKTGDILVTSDTIVWHKGAAINKPIDETDAIRMIKSLCNSTHEVMTSVCFKTVDQEIVVNDITRVTFNDLSEEEIIHYVETHEPLDKAGAYGIQDWIGLVGVTKVEGSYFNVMGLPVHLVYKTLKTIAEQR